MVARFTRAAHAAALDNDARELRCASEDLPAAFAFLDAVRDRRMDAGELREWLRSTFVAPGRMTMPCAIGERGLSPVWLHDRACASKESQSSIVRLLEVARARIVVTLRGLAAAQRDDRFVHAAIFNQRVRRVTIGSRAVWIARPLPQDALSDMVLTLFASQRLERGESFEHELGHCDECGRVFLDPLRLCRECHDTTPSARPPRPSGWRTRER